MKQEKNFEENLTNRKLDKNIIHGKFAIDSSSVNVQEIIVVSRF